MDSAPVPVSSCFCHLIGTRAVVIPLTFTCWLAEVIFHPNKGKKGRAEEKYFTRGFLEARTHLQKQAAASSTNTWYMHSRIVRKE